MPHHLWSAGVLASINPVQPSSWKLAARVVYHISALWESVCTCQSVYRSPLQECVWCWISSHTELHTEEWQCLVYDSGKHRGKDESKGIGRGTGDSSEKCRGKQKEGGFLRFFFKKNKGGDKEIKQVKKRLKRKGWEMSMVWEHEGNVFT